MSKSPEKDCHVDPIDKEVDPIAMQKASVAVLAISGMGCENCARRVRNALLSESGVLGADIELFLGTVRVRFDPLRASARDLVSAARAAGRDGRHEYRATVVSSTAGPHGPAR